MPLLDTRWLHYLLACCLALVGSCGGITIPRPSAENPTLLVLPAKMINETNQHDHGFSFAYEIVGASIPPRRVDFKLPFRSGMVIVDSLPAGAYRVKRQLVLPLGAGRKYLGQRSVNVDLPFTLRAGEMTIFDQSLNVRVYHMMAGRGMTGAPPMVGYETRVESVTPEQRKEILARLEGSSNLSAWRSTDRSD